MIPIRDHNPSSSTPWITHGLLLVNIAVFVYMFFVLGPSGLDAFVEKYAMQPGEIVRGEVWQALITSMFMHGGFAHIAGNMLFLHIFGDNLEDTLGKIKYLLFYFLCGLAASAAQIWTDPSSMIPNLGASGAIAGLLGGYLVLFPRHKVDVLVPFGGFLSRNTVPASAMLIYWIIGQFLMSWVDPGLGGGVAYWAHIGGFVAGVVLVKLLGGKRPELAADIGARWNR